MRKRRVLADRVDTQLSRNEQETSFHWFGDADRFEVVSYAPPIVKRVLRHDYAKIDWCFVEGPDERGQRIDTVSDIASTGDEYVSGVSATLPLGVLTVKGKPRVRDVMSGVITTPADAEDVAAAFEGA
jgi:hypothetical protein